MGGLAYTLTMVWAQAFPFFALHFYENNDMKEEITVFLTGSLVVWVLLNIAFFCTIDLTNIHTFLSTKTSTQYTCGLFNMSGVEDSQRYDAVFSNRIQYTKNIHSDVKKWVARNIDTWRIEQPAWFNAEVIPDHFLPKTVYEAEGGVNRRRRSSFIGSHRQQTNTSNNNDNDNDNENDNNRKREIMQSKSK